MTPETERRLFIAIISAVLVIPTTVGPLGAFGGLEGLAAVFSSSTTVAVEPGLRNHLRAIVWMFAMLGPMMLWTLRRGHLSQRATAFRIIIGFATVAGLVRIIGMMVDGYGGPLPVLFASMELTLPILVFWHSRLAAFDTSSARA